MVTKNPETKRGTPIKIEAVKVEGATRGSDERNPNGSFGGGFGQREGGLFLFRIQSFRKADGQTQGIVVPDRKLRPDLQFDAFVPDSAQGVGKGELRVSIATKTESEIAQAPR